MEALLSVVCALRAHRHSGTVTVLISLAIVLRDFKAESDGTWMLKTVGRIKTLSGVNSVNWKYIKGYFLHHFMSLPWAKGRAAEFRIH